MSTIRLISKPRKRNDLVTIALKVTLNNRDRAEKALFSIDPKYYNLKTHRDLKHDDRLLYIGYPELPDGIPMQLIGMSSFVIDTEISYKMHKKTKFPFGLFEPTLAKGFSGSPIYFYNEALDELLFQGIISSEIEYTYSSTQKVKYGTFVPVNVINDLLNKILEQ